jgi:hypothetical protein
VKLIADKWRAHEEAVAANKLPALEALKLLESDPLPTLDEALKLLKRPSYRQRLAKSKGPTPV